MGDKNKLQNQGGFVIIVALGMVMIGIILMAILQSANLRTIRNLADYVNHDHAVAFANSGMEILQFELKNKGAGYTTGEMTCTYGEYVAENAEGGGIPGICQDFDLLVGILDGEDKTNNVKIKAEIKGRATDGTNGTTDESFTDCAKYMPSGTASSACYVVPFPGTGNAGKNCEMYSPDFSNGETKKSTATVNAKTGKLESTNSQNQADLIKQIDYSCNWNKLQFGSSVIDRATIPLYYTKDDGVTVSPFSDDVDIGGNLVANSFVVRVRTPCKPVTDLATNKTETPVDCADNERYILKEDDGDDIVVQWQITGQCKKTASSTEYEEECGMIQFGGYENETKILPYFSAISEGRINFGSGMSTSHPLLHLAGDTEHKLLYPALRAVDTSEYEKLIRIAENPGKFTDFLKLPTMQNPTLSLFLSNKLISNDGGRVPYLEYQVLTSTPISDSKIKMEVSVTFNGNTYKKTIYKEEQKPLIDFAIQN